MLLHWTLLLAPAQSPQTRRRPRTGSLLLDAPTCCQLKHSSIRAQGMATASERRGVLVGKHHYRHINSLPWVEKDFTLTSETTSETSPCLSAVHRPLLLLYIDTCLQRLLSNPSNCLRLTQFFMIIIIIIHLPRWTSHLSSTLYRTSASFSAR